MAKNSLHEIFENLKLRVTSEVPAQNHLVEVEGKDEIIQDVKEFFSTLGADIIKDQKTLKAFQKKVADL
jgi:hypothetical protein